MLNRLVMLAATTLASSASFAACGADEEPEPEAPVCCDISRAATNDCMDLGGEVGDDDSCSGVCDGGASIRRLCADEAGCPEFVMGGDATDACDAPLGGWDAYDLCCPISYRHSCGDLYIGGAPDDEAGCAPPVASVPGYTLVLDHDDRGCPRWIQRQIVAEKEGSCNEGFFDEPSGETDLCCPHSIRPSCDHDLLVGGPRPESGECPELGPTPPVGWTLVEAEGSCAEWVVPEGAATDVCIGG